MTSALDRGLAAEFQARAWLEAQGYRCLTTHARTARGEVDLVMEHTKTVVFVEVRYRSSNTYGTPEETVDRRKQERLTRAALHWAQHQNLAHRPLRFDIVAITPTGLRHFPNAFVPRGSFSL